MCQLHSRADNRDHYVSSCMSLSLSLYIYCYLNSSNHSRWNVTKLYYIFSRNLIMFTSKYMFYFYFLQVCTCPSELRSHFLLCWFFLPVSRGQVTRVFHKTKLINFNFNLRFPGVSMRHYGIRYCIHSGF